MPVVLILEMKVCLTLSVIFLLIFVISSAKDEAAQKKLRLFAKGFEKFVKHQGNSGDSSRAAKRARFKVFEKNYNEMKNSKSRGANFQQDPNSVFLYMSEDEKSSYLGLRNVTEMDQVLEADLPKTKGQRPIVPPGKSKVNERRNKLRPAHSKGQGKGLGNSQGNSNGNSQGNANGNSEGNANGNSEGNANGNSEGNANGNSQGNANGNSQGNANGNSEGNANGNSEGNANGNSQGNAKGNSQENGKKNDDDKEDDNDKIDLERRQEETGLPSRLDLRNLNLVSAPRDQLSCGSCWAFGGTAALEGAFALATGTV